MTSSEFFDLFFSNLHVFIPSILLTCFALYFTVRLKALAGYLDPIHFYWTFTFGSAYGVVIGLYFLGYVSDLLFWFVFSCAFLFVVSFVLFSRFSSYGIRRLIVALTVPRGRGRYEFYLILFLYLCLLLVILTFVGAGLFAESNRFEQNRGFGLYVRIADAFRLFIFAYLSILLVRGWRLNGVSVRNALLLFFLASLIFVSSIVNGSKFAFLEALYACFVAISIYFSKPKFKVVYFAVVSLAAIFFALLVLMFNLRSNNVDTEADAMYMTGSPVVVERLVFRIIGNADKYYLGLPNDVVDKLYTDNALIRFVSPIVGVTRLSGILGYPVNDFNVGRQILLYYNPGREIAGGPTSHFDLFAYKYFGIEFAFVWVIFTAFLLAIINSLGRNAQQNIFYCALVATLWLRTLPILLEPPIGFAYMLDVIFLFFVIKLIGMLIPRKE
ncbi:hypothetical protein [Pseudomonas sp. MPDS]|uniref:hypothetical protein n=1 Tax=Pseudomonas sp. MPDS TaxID=2762896 RepID=UPI001565652A|nr:hypothetical protein [Pseudomonas sp. MPDS]QKJ36929.1 hypothetical protein HQ912_19660 [Pseudomonas sp. MPDS]